MTSPAEAFFFEHRVYLASTNAEGNVYFARYFELQGMAREEFFRRHVPDHLVLLSAGLKMITTNAWMVFRHESRLFDEITIQVQTANLKTMSLELVFTFSNKATGAQLGRGGQKLAFADHAGALISVPPSVRENAKRFLTTKAPELEALDATRTLR